MPDRPGQCAHAPLTTPGRGITPPPSTETRSAARRERRQSERDRNRGAILEAVAAGNRRVEEIAETVGLTPHTTQKHLDWLATSRKVRRSRSVIDHHWRTVYTIREEE